MHCIWKGSNSPKKAAHLRGSLLVQGLLLHKLSTRGYRGSEEAEEAVEEHAEKYLSLFCPCTVLSFGLYWPVTPWREKCPAVLPALHRPAKGVIYRSVYTLVAQAMSTSLAFHPKYEDWKKGNCIYLQCKPTIKMLSLISPSWKWGFGS